ncbi:MAG: RluA family pseudouridine synthase [Bacteroidota bacterium]
MNLQEFSRDILFEDNHLLVYNKRPSQIVQGDKTGDTPLSELIKQFIGTRDQKPGNVFLGVVHRIDRPVSGAIIFAKTGKALTRLNEMLKKGEFKKHYWAVVKNPPPPGKHHLIHYLKRKESENKSYAFDKPVENSQVAELLFETVAKSDGYYLLGIELLTGRHHQIRAQLAKIGSPIKGDLKYGFPRSNPDGSIHLHARQLEFIHPVKKELMVITAPPPDEPLWHFFQYNCKKEQQQG